MNPSFVLDCSVILSWCFRDEQNAYALSVLNRLENETAITPWFCPLEFYNVLLVAERKGRIVFDEVNDIVDYVARMGILLDKDIFIWNSMNLLQIARKFSLTSYDAVYLELAMRLRLPLATLDNELHSAAEASGVRIYDPNSECG